MESQERPTKGMCLCPHGSWLKTQLLFIWRVVEAFLKQSLGHRVKKRNKMAQREDAKGSCKANDHDCWQRKGESTLRRAADVWGGVESKVTYRPVLTERFWPRNLRRWGGPCSHMQAWAQSSAVLARVSSHTWAHRDMVVVGKTIT